MSDAADSPPVATLVDVATAPEATLVDLVLGTGAASRVLGMHGLLELGRLTPYALAQRTELALHDAQRLPAALELGRRVDAARSRRTRRLRSPRHIARFFESMLAQLVHEEQVWIDGARRPSRRVQRPPALPRRPRRYRGPAERRAGELRVALAGNMVASAHHALLRLQGQTVVAHHANAASVKGYELTPMATNQVLEELGSGTMDTCTLTISLKPDGWSCIGHCRTVWPTRLT
ncbi:hypothetical protein [Sorangium sp. So ce362]|uniref:hypothetical protein n=1 Tax=Sorangium sp. So ce362 TaxID=3133303 RepID=UPI003F620349